MVLITLTKLRRTKYLKISPMNNLIKNNESAFHLMANHYSLCLFRTRKDFEGWSEDESDLMNLKENGHRKSQKIHVQQISHALLLMSSDDVEENFVLTCCKQIKLAQF